MNKEPRFLKVSRDDGQIIVPVVAGWLQSEPVFMARLTTREAIRLAAGLTKMAYIEMGIAREKT